MNSIPAPAVDLHALGGTGVALVVRGYQNPVVVPTGDVILGRYDPETRQPMVDLTPFNAGGLGVSRRHARLQGQNDIYLIEDLGSTNGTWVNEKRLPAGKKQGLANGDLIQLGQLVLNIYFDVTTARRAVEERISFTITNSIEFTPHFLATRISPYLTALAAVQAVCDEVIQRDPSVIEINGITVDEMAIISVKLTGASEALRFAKGPLKAWRKDHAAQINRFLSMTELMLNRTTGFLMGEDVEMTGGSASDQVIVKELGRDLREGEIKLVFDFLREFGLPHDTDGHRDYVERMLKPLHVLAFSPLHVTTDSKSLAH